MWQVGYIYIRSLNRGCTKTRNWEMRNEEMEMVVTKRMIHNMRLVYDC